MFFSLLFVIGNDVSKQRHRNMELERLECTEKNNAKLPLRQSKKLIRRMEDISRSGRFRKACLWDAQSRSRHQPDDHTERCQNSNVVDGRSTAGVRGKVAGEKDLISRA